VSRIAALIPAAGRSSRYGGCKLLLEVGGKSLLQRTVDLANGVASGNVFVVTGAYRRRIMAATRDAAWIHNSRWREGLGMSIACGVTRIASGYDGILIVLADQVALNREDLQRLCGLFDGHNIACARYRGQRGAPALFCRESFPWLQRLTGDGGAKALLGDDRFPVAEVTMEHAAVDIDVPEDLHGYSGFSGES